jgi:hypothetical protein
MLVSQVSKIVDTLNVVPDELFWKILNWFEWLSNIAWLWLSRDLSARSTRHNCSLGLNTRK